MSLKLADGLNNTFVVDLTSQKSQEKGIAYKFNNDDFIFI